MVTTILNGTHRVPVPDDIREALGLEDGDVVVPERRGETIVLRTASRAETMYGIFKAHAIHPIPTDDELDDVIARAVAEDFASEDYGTPADESR